MHNCAIQICVECPALVPTTVEQRQCKACIPMQMRPELATNLHWQTHTDKARKAALLEHPAPFNLFTAVAGDSAPSN